MGRGTDAQREPLLAPERQPSAKPSECELHTTCFLNDGSRSNAEDQKRVQRKLLIACILCTAFMCIEVVGGYMAGSIAVLSDAAHMLSDVAGFAVSLFAAWAVTRRSHVTYSFGYHRVEILGALASVLAIWAVTGALVWEAVLRVLNPQPVDGKIMFIVACAGVAFNVVIALVLGEHHVHGVGGHCHGHDHDHGHGHGHSSDSDDDSHHGHGHGHGEGASHAHRERSNCCIISVPLEGGEAASSAVGVEYEAVIREKDHTVKVTLPAHSTVAAVPTTAHNHSHSHDSGHSHSHSHDHDHDHGHDHDHAPTNSAPKPAHSHDHGHGHDSDSDHSHSHGHAHGHSHENINLRSAVLHVIGDLLQSIGVAIAGAIIWWRHDDPRWQLADPICTFIFALLVLLTSRNIIRDIVHTLMERAPQHLDPTSITSTMGEMEGVLDVHDLHVWHLSMGIPILTAHVHVRPGADPDGVLRSLEAYVRRLGVRHSTIQICNPPVVAIGGEQPSGS